MSQLETILDFTITQFFPNLHTMNSASDTLEMAQRYLVLQLIIDEIMDPDECMVNIGVEKWFMAQMKAPELLHKL